MLFEDGQNDYVEITGADYRKLYARYVGCLAGR